MPEPTTRCDAVRLRWWAEAMARKSPLGNSLLNYVAVWEQDLADLAEAHAALREITEHLSRMSTEVLGDPQVMRLQEIYRRHEKTVRKAREAGEEKP